MRKAVRVSKKTGPAGSVVPETSVLITPLAQSPAFLVRLAQLRAFDEFYKHFAGLGVTPAGYAVFAIITANPGIRPGTIADELRVKPSNVAALVNALVAEGLVQRTVDASELRASLLHATPLGAKALADLERAHDEMDERFVAALSDSERARFVGLLKKLLHR